MKKLFIKPLIGIIISLNIFSCRTANQASQPYQPGESSSSRSKINTLTAGNQYALLLSPTNDQLQLLDLAINRVRLSVNTGRSPVDLAVSPSKRHIMVINRLDGTVSSYFQEDNRKISFTGTIGSGINPTDIIFNNNGTEAFVAYEGSAKIMVLGILNRDRPVSKKVLVLKDTDNVSLAPYKLAINQGDNSLYVIDKNNGRLFIFKKQNDSYTQERVISLNTNEKSTPEDIVFNKNKLYISDSRNSRIIIFDLGSNNISGNISLANTQVSSDLIPTKIAISPQNKLYVINQGSSTVAVVDLNNNALLKHINLAQNSRTDSSEPSDISISNDGNTIYVSNSVGRNLSIISGKDDVLIKNIGTAASSGSLQPISAIELI